MACVQGISLKETMERMKAAAEQAKTHGWPTWHVSPSRDCVAPLLSVRAGDWDDDGLQGEMVCDACLETEAAHIATCDPTTILALIAEVEAVMGENETLREVARTETRSPFGCPYCDTPTPPAPEGTV